MHDPAKILSDEALDILFRSARTYNGWLPEPVSDVKLQALYDLLKMGPTSANTCPARFIFVSSPAAKEKLKPCLAAGNVDTATLDVVANDDFMYGEPLPLATNATIVNVSNRARAGTGDDLAITGFVIGGTQPKTVLVRAVGPSLSAFVPATTRAALLANPQLAVFNGAGQQVVANDDWTNRAELAQAAALVGALPLAANSLDAAVLAVLPPGAYTVVVNGANGTSGIVLTEVFEAK